MLNIASLQFIAAKFRKIAEAEVEPGHEHKRYATMKSTFFLGSIVGSIFTTTTAALAYLWSQQVHEYQGFLAPTVFGSIAALVPQYFFWSLRGHH